MMAFRFLTPMFEYDFFSGNRKTIFIATFLIHSCSTLGMHTVMMEAETFVHVKGKQNYQNSLPI